MAAGAWGPWGQGWPARAPADELLMLLGPHPQSVHHGHPSRHLSGQELPLFSATSLFLLGQLAGFRGKRSLDSNVDSESNAATC